MLETGSVLTCGTKYKVKTYNLAQNRIKDAHFSEKCRRVSHPDLTYSYSHPLVKLCPDALSFRKTDEGEPREQVCSTADIQLYIGLNIGGRRALLIVK